MKNIKIKVTPLPRRDEKETFIPDSFFPWKMKPRLTFREWQVLLFLSLQKTSLKYMKDMDKKTYCGSRITEWRAKKRLKEKGYLL